MMLGAQGLRGPAGRLGFRIGGFLEDERERLEPGGSQPRHERHDAGGVQSAGEKSPYWHVGDAMRPHGVIEPLAQFAGEILRGGADPADLRRGWKMPPLFDLEFPAGPARAFTRTQAEHALVNRAGVGTVKNAR